MTGRTGIYQAARFLMLAQISASLPAARAQGVDGLQRAPVSAVQQDELTQQDVAVQQTALSLPFDSQTGVAAFWSGPDFIIVVDKPVPALTRAFGGHGVFSSLDVTVLDHATLVRLHLPRHPTLSLGHDKDGWLLTVVSSGTGLGSRSVQQNQLTQRSEPGFVLFPLRQPGHIVSLPDPASGARLLIATSRLSTGGWASAQHNVGYSLRPTLEGLVVEADSDQMHLQASTQSAVLRAVAVHPLPVGLPFASTGSDSTQGKDWLWLGLRKDTAESLKKQCDAAFAALAKAGPRQKDAASLKAAQAAFASGAFQQAASVLGGLISVSTHSEQDQATTSASLAVSHHQQVAFLYAASSLLAGDTKSASILNEPDWGRDPELRLWQGVYGLYAGQNSQITATVLASAMVQAKQYPAPIRDRILPPMAAFIARYGSLDAVRAVGDLPDGSDYDLVRALLQMRDGKLETARIALENMTAADNVQTAAYARTDIVRVMRDADLIAPDMAVAAYRKLLKNDGATGPLPAGVKALTLLGLVQALTQNGEPRAALAILTSLQPGPETPEDSLADAYRAAAYRLVFGAPHNNGPAQSGGEEELSVPQRLALVAQILPRLPDGAEKAKVLMGYGRLLLTAEQPDAAVTVFKQADIMLAAPLARAEASELLAQAAMKAHHLSVAQHAIDQAASPLMPDDLAARRAYDAARVAQAQGDTDKALALLAHDESDAGLDLRGQLYEADHKWADAVLVVGRLASRALPEQGALTESQRALAFRLAGDATAAHDAGTLQRLKAWLAGRTLGRERDELITIQLQQVGHKPASP